MAEPIALISGVGPGTGAALARRFAAGGHRVAMLARDGERLAALEREIAGARGVVCDVGDAAQVDAAVETVRRELGAPSVLIHNAVGGAFANFLDLDPAVLEHNFRVNVMGLLHLARRLAPAMIEAGAAPSSRPATRRRCVERRTSPASRPPRRRSASWPSRWRATSGRRGCTSPTS